ncbi:hypothetical protein EMIHUDRAFT_442892 [Emiliania huxleyi CCMP1516]|uniref:Methyltransferase type 11 domain-containing protein n=4 Tax=Emiliania huxleyi TaxID=2903 RepID=A0A0D3JZB7_EMIH1|nr:hypothetical protein EMIHUDRAFT_442892 [Emiliania huxleyi CCMP1516]EOD28852.1 hypothetical protein EMIHUDRAFT_442892 [Emiliania huxleyi CCMP1516]|eukprot:XP_005781281.1 hypothetical protein EMIHUDRAFT_442892 [Emiliania huxleyi CCMP1516]
MHLLLSAGLLLGLARPAAKQRLAGLFGADADPVLACPRDGSALFPERAIYGRTRREARVSAGGVRYPVADGEYVDLLASSGRGDGDGITPGRLAEEVREAFATRTQTQMFRTPVLGFLYERGWRQQFRAAGFPGIEKEYDEVSAFFEPVAAQGRGVVVDMSCGSGLMYRRLLAGRIGGSGRTLACDYSEVMLKETRRRALEQGLAPAALELLRCDVAQLPMRDGAVDAMHAGAALHSWPNLEKGLSEIRRVLRPDGGRFFATTFLRGAYPGTTSATPGQSGGGGGSFRFFESEEELRQLLIAAGFPPDGVSVRREGRGCAIVKAVLGGAAAGGGSTAAAAAPRAAVAGVAAAGMVAAAAAPPSTAAAARPPSASAAASPAPLSASGGAAAAEAAGGDGRSGVVGGAGGAGGARDRRRDGAGAGEASGKAALEATIAQEEEEMIEELLDDQGIQDYMWSD